MRKNGKSLVKKRIKRKIAKRKCTDLEAWELFSRLKQIVKTNKGLAINLFCYLWQFPLPKRPVCTNSFLLPFWRLYSNLTLSSVPKSKPNPSLCHIVRKLVKMSHLNFSILAFSTIFKLTCLATLFDHMLRFFKNIFFWHF